MSESTLISSIRSAAQIRKEFIDFFVEKQGHTFAPSSPVVPHDDPTLLFTNAGMNQFKDVFLAQGNREYSRAVNTQKCIRAGGKHNDLEDVGRDTYHHTFFEMLGNWSFGDYFKPEAIAWAWELLTDPDGWGLDPQRLYVTVFAGDEADGLQPDLEAEEIWKRFVPGERISRWDKKDNFWEMGETGPCGPCSEIHYDGRPPDLREKVSGSDLVNRDHPDVIEIWNLVFIQFNRGEGGALTPLPAKHVDTGMGFERLVRILQGKTSNYDTDIWSPIFKAIGQETGTRKYSGLLDDPVDVAYRVLADHVRCLTVALTDGARPGNEGRSYVLRRILRRAVRVAHQTMGVKGPVLFKLVPAVVESLGEAFPELKKNPEQVAHVIKEEEESFLKTLDRGLILFDEAAGRTDDHSIAAQDAFKLHDTYGFPIDLTRVMAEERGMTVDLKGYEKLMEDARVRSRSGGDDSKQIFTLPPEAMARLKHLNIEATHDEAKYANKPITARLRAIWNGTDFDEHSINVGKYELVALITDRTNFYAEQGGQIFDTGTIRDVDDDHSNFKVLETHSFGEYILHFGRLGEGRITVGESVQLTVGRARRLAIQANHTATHLLNLALRAVLVDEEINQKGSLVAEDRLRFDFTCGRGMKPQEMEQVEAMVNKSIAENLAVHTDTVPLALAKKIHGVRAVFGERYPDPVRVVSIGVPVVDLVQNVNNADWQNSSIEFCGGTHLATTEEAGQFVLIHESALAAGVRRITALTGAAAVAAKQTGEELAGRVTRAESLEGDALVSAYDDLAKLVDEMTLSTAVRLRIRGQLDALHERVKVHRKQAQSASRDVVVERARTIASGTQGDFVVEKIAGATIEMLGSAMDVIRAKQADAAIMLFSADIEAGKVSIVASVSKSLIARGLKAGDWVKVAAGACGGGGGGRPDRAQAGGKDPSKIDEAMEMAQDFARRAIES